jgi:polyphosphate kinase
MSANIEAIRIIDRYLEHARCFVFENKGTPLVYLASADWMGRNLDRRVEVAFPVLDPQLQRQVRHLLDLQWQDTAKARTIDRDQKNMHRKAARGATILRSQEATYRFIKRVR